MRYKLELVGQKVDDTGHVVVGSPKRGDFQVYRVQRLASSGEYAPSAELINAFTNASEELRAIYSKVVAQRD